MANWIKYSADFESSAVGKVSRTILNVPAGKYRMYSGASIDPSGTTIVCTTKGDSVVMAQKSYSNHPTTDTINGYIEFTTPFRATVELIIDKTVGGSRGTGVIGLDQDTTSLVGKGHVKINGAWKPTVGQWVKINGAWKVVSAQWVKINGVWKSQI